MTSRMVFIAFGNAWNATGLNCFRCSRGSPFDCLRPENHQLSTSADNLVNRQNRGHNTNEVRYWFMSPVLPVAWHKSAPPGKTYAVLTNKSIYGSANAVKSLLRKLLVAVKMLAEEIKKNALKLDVVARVHLVESLLESLDKTDPEIEKIWVAESEKRYHAYKQGLVTGVSLERLRTEIDA